MLDVDEQHRIEAAAEEHPLARDLDEKMPTSVSDVVKHYARDGREISIGTWTLLMNDRAYSRVAFDELFGYEVSTVWIGLDMNDQLFETMVFARDENDPGHHDCYRWRTEAEALAGHDEVLTVIRATRES